VTDVSRKAFVKSLVLQIVIPMENGNAHSLVGRLFKEDLLVAVAREIQDELGFDKLRPDMAKVA